MRFINLPLYRCLTQILYPMLWLWDRWRSYSQTIYKNHNQERWAKLLPIPVHNSMIWIHAVSVGETQACAPLLRSLIEHYPKDAILLTHMTPSGRDTGASLFATEISLQKVQQCYLPYDIARLSHRFLKHFTPKFAVIMETEIWPNLVANCRELSIPLGLANGRMSEKTLQKTLRFKSLATQTYDAFDWLAAQSAADALRFSRLRTKKCVITGNLKFDVTPNMSQLALGNTFKLQQERLCILLASTRQEEEALLLPLVLQFVAKQSIPALILLVPRHPNRAPEIMQLLGRLHLNVAQRSKGQQPTAQTQVYFGDTLGEMWFYYGASDIAIVGGGWLPHGGQNPIEPCMAGCATVIGPHMFNFATISSDAIAANAVLSCIDSTKLPAALHALNDVETRLNQIKSALNWSKHHQGATAQHLQLIQSICRSTQPA